MARQVRLLLVFLLTVLALGAPATASGQSPPGGEEPRFKALIFSETAAFRHTECIPSGTVALAQAALRENFDVDATENSAAFNAGNLEQYDVVIFLCTTGDVLNAAQQTAFEEYIRDGGGYAGIHSASDTEYDWAWYGGLVGAYFRDHPAIQEATIRVEDRRSAATRDLPRLWEREEEWYNFRANPRRDVHVLLSVDESTYNPGNAPMGDHPISWCHRYDGGRAFYTGLGHRGVYWDEPLLLRHVIGGIEMAAGVEPFRCRPGDQLEREINQIWRDCARDDDIDRAYTLRALRAALRRLPDDLAEYTNCARAIERAIRRAQTRLGREVYRIYNDCSRDDRIDREYSLVALRRALRWLPEDLREYTDCERAIRRAITRKQNQIRNDVERIFRDCSRDGDLDRLYDVESLRAALRRLPDEAQGSGCNRAIRRAIRQATRP